MKFWPIGCKDFLPRYNFFYSTLKTPHQKTHLNYWRNKVFAVFTAWLDTCTLWVFFKSESEEEVVVRLSWYTKISLISTSSNKRPIYLRNSHWLVSVHFSVFGFFSIYGASWGCWSSHKGVLSGQLVLWKKPDQGTMHKNFIDAFSHS